MSSEFVVARGIRFQKQRQEDFQTGMKAFVDRQVKQSRYGALLLVVQIVIM